MPMRLGRLQRQSRRAFWASAAAGSVHVRACWLVLGETDANGRARTLALASESMIRAGPHRFTGRRPRRPRKGDHPIAG